MNAVRRDCDVIVLTLPARAEYIAVARLAVSGVANRLGFAYDDIEDIKLAVAEACTNAVRHAYGSKEGNVLIQCWVYEDRLDIYVADKGDSFDVEEICDKLGPIDRYVDVEHLTEGGLGLYLIHSLMDQVRISVDDGVVVMMTKYRQRNKEGGHGSGGKEPPQTG